MLLSPEWIFLNFGSEWVYNFQLYKFKPFSTHWLKATEMLADDVMNGLAVTALKSTSPEISLESSWQRVHLWNFVVANRSVIVMNSMELVKYLNKVNDVYLQMLEVMWSEDSLVDWWNSLPTEIGGIPAVFHFEFPNSLQSVQDSTTWLIGSTSRSDSELDMAKFQHLNSTGWRFADMDCE